jgi:hypothetical protein
MSPRQALFVGAVTGACGAYYLLVGLALFFAPAFFYAHVAQIGTFNGHYMRDLGSFLIPLGVALIWAASDPRHNVSVLAFAAVASAFHVASHIMDGVVSLTAELTIVFFGVVAIGLASATAVTWRSFR